MSAILPIVIAKLSARLGGRCVLDGIDATLSSPEVTAVIGPNGAGKSVLLRVIDGLIPAEGGSIRFGTRAVRSVRRAFVFQKPALVRASVAYNVALALTPARLGRSEIRDRVEAALRKVGLADRAADPAGKLSGGEQQRLALARAAVTEPELLLLDEPTANLDPGATEEIEELVAAMARSGTKVVLVSHNLGQVARMADDVLVVARGRAVEHGPVDRVLAHPQTPEARAYINGELPWTSFAAVS